MKTISHSMNPPRNASSTDPAGVMNQRMTHFTTVAPIPQAPT
jgi:hypothetical protein